MSSCWALQLSKHSQLFLSHSNDASYNSMVFSLSTPRSSSEGELCLPTGCQPKAVRKKKNPTLNISIYLHSNPLICILLNVLCTLLMQKILTANICSLQSKGNWEPKTLRNCVWVTRLSPCLGYCDYWHSKYSGSKGNLSKNNDKSFPFWKYSKLSKFSINSTCNISRSHNFH